MNGLNWLEDGLPRDRRSVCVTTAIPHLQPLDMSRRMNKHSLICLQLFACQKKAFKIINVVVRFADALSSGWAVIITGSNNCSISTEL